MHEPVPTSQDAAPSPFSRLRGGLRGALRLALDVALPPLCPSCRTPLGDGIGLCVLVEAVADRATVLCAWIPFTYDPGPGVLSLEAIADPPVYDRARSGAL